MRIMKKEEMAKKKSDTAGSSLNEKHTDRKVKMVYFSACLVAVLFAFSAVPAFAADDPLRTINNLSDFIFGAIRAIGIIMLGFGIVQIGLSLKSHDASQRANGLMTFFGGIVIAFSKSILDLILQ